MAAPTLATLPLELKCKIVEALRPDAASIICLALTCNENYDVVLRARRASKLSDLYYSGPGFVKIRILQSLRAWMPEEWSLCKKCRMYRYRPKGKGLDEMGRCSVCVPYRHTAQYLRKKEERDAAMNATDTLTPSIAVINAPVDDAAINAPEPVRAEPTQAPSDNSVSTYNRDVPRLRDYFDRIYNETD